MSGSKQTIIDKIYADHKILELDAQTDLIAIDRIIMHERVGGRMLKGVKAAGHAIANPSSVFGVMDHIIDTFPGRTDKTLFPGGGEFISSFREMTKEYGIRLFDLDSSKQGIVHVMAPEQAIAQPGGTLVCGDSHTCSIGGLGALAWGVGITQGEHALSTQTLPVSLPRQMRVNFENFAPNDVTAKDLALALIGKYGAGGGEECVVEFAGPCIRALGVEGRLTLCNLAVEFGAWTGLIAPDDKVFDYLYGRPFAPKGRLWDAALERWKSLNSDNEASFHKEINLDCSTISPQVTWGTSPEHVVGVDDVVPDPRHFKSAAKRKAAEQALSYIDLTPGTKMSDIKIEAAFIGSCTNARIEDLRSAASVLKGKKISPNIKALCVPGSTPVKRQAEAEGLDNIFKDAGFEWREAGCSLCFYASGESFGEAKRVISSTNRNFENRQGPGVRTHLASPATVAASAVSGRISRAGRM